MSTYDVLTALPMPITSASAQLFLTFCRHSNPKYLRARRPVILLAHIDPTSLAVPALPRVKRCCSADLWSVFPGPPATASAWSQELTVDLDADPIRLRVPQRSVPHRRTLKARCQVSCIHL